MSSASPDVAVEVFLTSGGIDKLDVYRGLGVPEVWIWKDGRIAVHALGESGYEQVERSGMLPELDLGALAECARLPDQADAVDAYWERLKRGG